MEGLGYHIPLTSVPSQCFSPPSPQKAWQYWRKRLSLSCRSRRFVKSLPQKREFYSNMFIAPKKDNGQ